MSLTLKKVLEMPNFSGMTIIAGSKGISREVTSVTVMDAPDISDWLKGGEILLTTGYIMKDDTLRLADLITKINQKNAAAIFIKMERFIDILPKEVYETAERLNFPIVSTPISFAFTDVINPVLSRVVNEQAYRIKISENIHRSFTNIVLNGGDNKQIIKTLGKIVGSSCAYIDIMYGKDCSYSESEVFTEDIEKRDLHCLLSNYKNYSVRIGKKNYGYIIYSDSKNADSVFRNMAIEHAGTVLKFNIQRQISNYEIENRHKTEFVWDLISGNIKSEDELKSKSLFYEWSCKAGIYTVMAAIDDYEQMKKKSTRHTQVSLENSKEKIFNSCIKNMKSVFNQLLFASINDHLVMLIEPEGGRSNEFFNRIIKAADEARLMSEKQFGYTLTFGIGNYHASGLESKESYIEAETAIKIGTKLFKKDRTVTYRSLGVYKLLEPLYNTNQADEFCDSLLGKLKAYDAAHSTDLLDTLVCIKESDWNLKLSAEKMFIHYNTIKYRYSKIKELLNIDLENSEERFNISMCIKLMFMRE